MKVKGTDFIVYYVSDLERAVAWYRDILGLDLTLFKRDWNWVEFSVPPTTLVLFGDYPGAPLASGQRGGVGIAFAVENLEAAVLELREKGVLILDGPHVLDACSVATITDPDQNPICLHQRKDGSCG